MPKPTIFELDALASVVEKWQRVLGLDVWDIGVAICRERDMRRRAEAEIMFNWPTRRALLHVIDPLDYAGVCPVHPQDMELDVVHELLHLMTSAWRTEEGSLEDGVKEQFLTDMARVLVAQKRAAERRKKR